MSAYDFQSALDNLAGGAPQTLWAIAFCTPVLTAAHVALDHGGDARLGVLAVGCDEVLAEGEPSTFVPGFDVGRLRFVLQAVGEFLGVRVGFHRLEHVLMLTQGGVIDPDVTYFGEGDDRNVGPQLGFQDIVGVRSRCEQDGCSLRKQRGGVPLLTHSSQRTEVEQLAARIP